MHWEMFDDPRLTIRPASQQTEISLSDPQNPILRALTFPDEQLTAVQVEVAPLQPCCLRQSETGIKHQGQHEAIAFAGRIPWVRLLEKRYLLLGTQYLGELARTSAVCVHQQSLSEVEDLNEA